jgi:hypothetical protein
MIKTSIDCFNSKDGTGLFSGISRYQRLSGRVEIAAMQARTPLEFWGLLLRRMLWQTPPARMDEKILELLNRPEASEAIKIMSSNAAAIVMIARYWHHTEKPVKEHEENEKEGEDIETLFG